MCGLLCNRLLAHCSPSSEFSVQSGCMFTTCCLLAIRTSVSNFDSPSATWSPTNSWKPPWASVSSSVAFGIWHWLPLLLQFSRISIQFLYCHCHKTQDKKITPNINIQSKNFKLQNKTSKRQNKSINANAEKFLHAFPFVSSYSWSLLLINPALVPCFHCHAAGMS